MDSIIYIIASWIFYFIPINNVNKAWEFRQGYGIFWAVLYPLLGVCLLLLTILFLKMHTITIN